MANLSVRRKVIWSHSVVDIAHAPELLGIGYVAGGDVIETLALRDDMLGQDYRIRTCGQEAAADIGHRSTISSLKRSYVNSVIAARGRKRASCHSRPPIPSMLCVPSWFKEARMADRKITRLNSSHQIISYAVFCFIKKK